MPLTLVLVLVPTAPPATCCFPPLSLSSPSSSSLPSPPCELDFPGPSVGDGAASEVDEVVAFATGMTARAWADEEDDADVEALSGVGEAVSSSSVGVGVV